MSVKTALKLSTAAAILFGLSAAPALAQSGDEADARRLDPVVTTAQRIEQDAQDVPISITTVSDEKLDNLKAGGADVRFLSARVPSVIAESSFGRAFPRFYIRGYGNTDFDLNSTQPVSLVYDDIPYENPILKGYPVFDMEAVEVLRGPQGTLFGRNTPGGIIKFDSVKPSQDFDAYARGSYGTYNTFDLEGAVGGALTDKLSARLSVLHQSRDNYVDNGFTGETDQFEGFEVTSGRLQFLLEPTDTLDLLLNIHALTNEGSARLFRANIIDQGQRGLGSNFDRDTVFFDGGDGNLLTQDSAGINFKAVKDFQNGWDFTYIFGLETTETSSRGDIDGGAIDMMGTFIPSGPFNFPSDTQGGIDDLTQTTHEARFAFDDGGPLRAQTGVFFFDEEVEITSLAFAGDFNFSGATRAQDSQSVGIFGSLSYDVTEQLTVSGGLRYTDDEKDFTATRIVGTLLGPLTENVSDEQISWDISATYAVNDDVNVYGRVATGYRGPSVQGRIVFGSTLSVADSETIISYEAGAKTELFDNRVRLNSNVFYYEISDQQLTVVGGQNNTVQLINADKGEAYGFEADLEAVVTENFLVTGGLSYNKTEIKDDVLLSPGCGTACTVLDPAVTVGSSTFFNISGNSFPNAPEWIANVTARYSIPVESGELYAFTDWAYKGDTNFFLYESVEFFQEGYWEGGLRLGYASEHGYDVSVFGRNITDEDALTGGIDFTTLTGFVNEPQTFGIEFRYDF
ncbi:MAG: TonB-dependent receptor [Hyphomonas sp.]|nr:TonB-dependent receptor [Hyphomonas sp.]